MASMFLKIENPGVAPSESFTLIGASTKDSANGNTIGRFGTGNKQGISLLGRHKSFPTVFCGNLKMEFSTTPFKMSAGQRQHFNKIFVKYSGRTQEGKTRNDSAELGFVLENGQEDWTDVKLALREFVSNALDRAYEEEENEFIQTICKDKGVEWCDQAKVKGSIENVEWTNILREYRKTAKSYKNVTVEIVEENQVRAKTGTTRIFVPLSSDVLEFYQNIGKWFLHFSEPEALFSSVLLKKNRNIGSGKGAVIYRRGVFVREIEDQDSIFDYNLEGLKLDESRTADDYSCSWHAGFALATASTEIIQVFLNSLLSENHSWERDFATACFRVPSVSNWVQALGSLPKEVVFSRDSIFNQILQRKGYQVCTLPYGYVELFNRCNASTDEVVLTTDERSGKEYFDDDGRIQRSIDQCWNLLVKHGLTNGKCSPTGRYFVKIMDGGSQLWGYWSPTDGAMIHVHRDCSDTFMNKVVMEEIAHYVTGATDNSRDFQDFLLRLIAAMMGEAK